MKAAQALLSLCALLPLSASGEGEGEKPARPAPPMTRELLERGGQDRGWKPMTFKEDEFVLVGGTCDAKKVEETFGLCRQALDRFSVLFKASPQDLTKNGKMWFLVMSEKKEFMSLASTPKMQELCNRVAAGGNYLCIDRVYGTTPETDRHLTAHLFTHRLLDAYEGLHGGTESPGWITEGLCAWMDGTVTGAPGTCCIAKVGYDEENYKGRTAGERWEQTLAAAAKKYLEMKEKDRITAEYTPLRNLVGKPFDKLTGTDVAASWHLIQTLTGDKRKPEAFKAFVDAVLGGGKQPDAFREAFGRSLDEFEKGWMKAVAAKFEPPPDPKKRK